MTLEELAARVAALEERFGMESGLRASQDRDLSDLAAAVRAQTTVGQAMATRQIEHGASLRDHTARLDRLEGKVDRLDAGVQRLQAGQAIITGLLQTLIDREGS